MQLGRRSSAFAPADRQRAPCAARAPAISTPLVLLRVTLRPRSSGFPVAVFLNQLDVPLARRSPSARSKRALVVGRAGGTHRCLDGVWIGQHRPDLQHALQFSGVRAPHLLRLFAPAAEDVGPWGPLQTVRLAKQPVRPADVGPPRDLTALRATAEVFVRGRRRRRHALERNRPDRRRGCGRWSLLRASMLGGWIGSSAPWAEQRASGRSPRGLPQSWIALLAYSSSAISPGERPRHHSARPPPDW